MDQQLKPDDWSGYYYENLNDFQGVSGWHFFKDTSPRRYLDTPADKYEIFSFEAEARSNAAGAQGGLQGIFIPTMARNWSSFGDLHPGHSAEFRSIYMKSDRRLYWNLLLESFEINAVPMHGN